MSEHGISMDEARRLMDEAKKLGIPNNPCVPAPVGSGPEGETCRTCRHYVRVGNGARAYPKCNLMQHHWTHGAGTDIKAKWPACKKWEERE